MYDWRKMKPVERKRVLSERIFQGYPGHRPPHQVTTRTRYHLSATCFEHRPIIGYSSERMAWFEDHLLTSLSDHIEDIFTWCILPNHYHILVQTESITSVLSEIGKIHGRTSFQWNGEENKRGRKCWYRCTDRAQRSKRHKLATMNYIHFNPVYHNYVQHYCDWPYSSAKAFVDTTPPDIVEYLWREYPLLDFGKGWDVPDL